MFRLPDSDLNSNTGEQKETITSSHWFMGDPWTGTDDFEWINSGLKNNSNTVGLSLSADVYTYFTHNWHHRYSTNEWNFHDDKQLFTLTPVGTYND